MIDDRTNDQTAARPAYAKPELQRLDVEETATGTTPDPTEFDPFLNMS